MHATQTAFIEVKPRPRLGQLPICERPTTRILHFGQTSVSNVELLSILAGGGKQLEIAHALFAKFGSLLGIARASVAELTQMRGVSDTTAARIKAAIEIGRRALVESPEARPQITSPADAAHLLQFEMSMLDQEEVRLLTLDTRNRVIKQHMIYRGSLNTSLVRIGELFRNAINESAAAIILVHNHPSGDPTPSPEDVRLTEMVVEAGKLLDIEVLDHLIIGQGRFVSLKERGLGFR